MGMLNDTCPMMGSELGPEAQTLEYKGNTIGFCCEGCIPAWNKLSDSEKADKVAAMKN